MLTHDDMEFDLFLKGPFWVEISSNAFCNAIMADNQFEMHCLREHLSTNAIVNMREITNWKGYLINMEMPYE